MSKLRRLLIACLVGIASLPLLHWVLAEAALLFQMWYTGAMARSELEDDFGFGMLGLFVVTPAAFVGSIVVAVVIWFRLGRVNGTDSRG